MKIALLGYGWLGEIFTSQNSEKYSITVTTRSKKKRSELQQLGLAAELYSIEDNISTKIFKDSDIVISMLPPGLRKNKSTNVDEYIIQAANQCSGHFILTSSTSVYGSHQNEVNESTNCEPSSRSGRFLLDLENRLKELLGERLTIIRPGGLVGPKRNPSSFYKKRPITNPDGLINFVHGSDVSRAIDFIIDNQLWGKTFNLCFPEKITRKDFYTKLMGSTASFCKDNGEKKRVLSKAILDQGFEFQKSINSID